MSGLVFPRREKRMNSRVKCQSRMCYLGLSLFKLVESAELGFSSRIMNFSQNSLYNPSVPTAP
jgi:hypothetical protein